jgi:ubiquinone/menaquinone biosynthesis C-methylase UbiE
MKLSRYPRVLLGGGEPKAFLKPRELLIAVGVQPGDRVVDLGSGGGYFTIPISELVGPGGKVYAVDRNLEVLSSLDKSLKREGLGNVESLAVDFEQVAGSISGPVDWVVLSRVLSMISERAEALAAAADLAGPAGSVLVVEWREGMLFPEASRYTVSEAEVDEVARRVGLGAARDVPAGSYHWAKVYRRTG